MVTCEELLQFWNDYLNIPSVPDESQNGLQVQGKANVNTVVFGVSATLELFEKAHRLGADLICVHHGLLWGQPERLTGLLGERVRFLMQHNMGLAAYHLPLDKHPKIGHNACLARALNVQHTRPFGKYHGVEIGFAGNITPTALPAVTRTLEDFCRAPAQVFAFGPQEIKTVGIVSGGAYSMLPQAVEQKLDLYVTGILDEPAYAWCREGNINCIALGHYHSEKCGVEALAKLTAQKLAVQTEFIEIENPL